MNENIYTNLQEAIEAMVKATIRREGERHFVFCMVGLKQSPHADKLYLVKSYQFVGSKDARTRFGGQLKPCYYTISSCESIRVHQYGTNSLFAVFPIPRLTFDLYHYYFPQEIQRLIDSGAGIPNEMFQKLPKQAEDYAALWNANPWHGTLTGGYYLKIARVAAISLDKAFYFSNNHDLESCISALDQAEWNWTMGEYVTLTRQGFQMQSQGFRSTSIGDVFGLPISPTEDGFVDDLFFLVENCGFSLLPDRTPVSNDHLFPSILL